MSRLLEDVPDLRNELVRLLRQIPDDRITTYGDLARALGDVKAARWVGEYLLDHPHDDDCPCYRVVRKGGEVGLFISGDRTEKIARLTTDGFTISDDRVAHREPMFTDFDSTAPLRSLRHEQLRLPQDVSLEPLDRKVRTIGGIDVSYVSPTWGVAAYVKLDAATHEVLWSTTVIGPVRFPYITGYLTFREVPLYVDLFAEVRRQSQEASVTLVDGNGILHPRRAGSACACGVAVETPTIGIGKKLLCGRVALDGLRPREPLPVRDGDEIIGTALNNGPNNRPFFLSPGHRIDMSGAIDVVLASLGSGRLPLPIGLADRLSREEATRIKQSESTSEYGFPNPCATESRQ